MSTKPKRTLLAYCALASRLSTSGVGPMEALAPFFAAACKKFCRLTFDADQFSAAVNEQYGIVIPRLAVLGLAEELHHAGILTILSRTAHTVVYRYSDQMPGSDAENALTEREIELVLNSFVMTCRLDKRLQNWPDDKLHQALLDRLLNVDSMRILVRREASITSKTSASTLQLKHPPSPAHDATELHLDFLVSQFLMDLRDNDSTNFDRVSSVAFANMAAEAVACFREPPAAMPSLSDLTVYLDSPLLLDMLGVNEEYEAYGKELLDVIRANGVTTAVFEHSVTEAENTIKAQLDYLRSGINQLTSNNRTTAKPDHLAALTTRVAERARERLSIAETRAPETALHRRSPETVGNIDAAMDGRMQAWGNAEAKDYDRKTVWAMLSLSQTSVPCARICDARSILLTHNTALVKITNEAWHMWLRGVTTHGQSQIESWAPLAMSDKQFAGYLWARQGGGDDGAISKARLLAHCSAAIRPRSDVKARAYNLAIELFGQDKAQDFAALFEDREGGRALMRATSGDPEDVTKERLPFIMDQVKRQAGEYAAAKVREEAEHARLETERLHVSEREALRRSITEADQSKAAVEKRMDLQLAQKQIETAELAAQKQRLEEMLSETDARDKTRRLVILRKSFDQSWRAYWGIRWGVVLLFGATAYWIASVPEDLKWLAPYLSVLSAVGGFYFVPNLLDKPINSVCEWHLRTKVKSFDQTISIPESSPDFLKKTWLGVTDS
jgi:hypothetical protein